MARIFDCKIRQERLEATKEKRARKAQEQKELRIFRKELGLCVRCGKNDALTDNFLCQDCREKNNKSRIGKKNKPMTIEQKGRYKIYQKKYYNVKYNTRKNNNLCVRCGEKPALPDMVLCQDCRLYNNQSRSGYVNHSLKYIEKERRLGRLNG